jgi:HEAT repeat protein
MCRTIPILDRLAMSCAVALVSALVAFPSLDARAQEAPAPSPDGSINEPKTPLELWDEADFLIRTGHAGQAVPYLKKFMDSKPDDATLLAIRDRFGVVSILRLEDDPATRPLVGPLVQMLAEASHRNATNPERIQKFIGLLTKSPAEQVIAVEALREAGPEVVPFLVQTLGNPGLSAEDRAQIVNNMGRLEHSTVPPLIATLDSAEIPLAADAATVLGRLGDLRALPQLTFVATQGDTTSPLRAEARRAVERMTGKPFDSQPLSPVRVLINEARGYHLHAVRFPGDTLILWTWDAERKVPVSRQVSRSEAEAILGLRLAREALQLEPANVPAQVVFLSLALEKSVERIGFANFPARDPETFASAMAAGPNILGQVIRTALTDGKYDLAAAAVIPLGQVTDADALTRDRRPNPLVESLSAPNRRVQLAAARALVLLEPRRPFAGSSRVVPILARFVTNQAPPRAVVIDGNLSRGSQLVGFLKQMGYEPMLAATGDEGFRVAADSADVELILVDNHLVQGDWRLTDTLSNLKADARTAGIPVYVVGPLNLDTKLSYLASSFPGVKLLVTPTNAAILERQLGGRPMNLSDAERAGYAVEAAGLLARLTVQQSSPFERDLDRAEPALTIALNTPPTSLAASAALGDLPVAGAQRSLADVLLDPSKPPQLRLSTAAQLARSLQRFGPLMSADQEATLASAFTQETDPALRTGLATVLGALRPKPPLTGRNLSQYRAPAPPAEAVPPVPTPAAPEPEK